jgi:ribonuclease HII
MKKENILEPYILKSRLEAGCDEAGRGCLVGPVVAAAVILPPDFKHEWLNDSKQLTEKKRDILRDIIEKESISWAVSFVDHLKIDQINILNASILAMHQAVDRLKIQPDFLLIDGNRFHKHKIPHTCFVKGDARFRSIAAASILAKTHRDEFVMQMHDEYPCYNWDKNKGYATKAHRESILMHGVSVYQRKSFNVKKDQLEIGFD